MVSHAIPKGAIILPGQQDDTGMQEEHIGIIIGSLAALIMLLFATAVFIIICNKACIVIYIITYYVKVKLSKCNNVKSNNFL